MTAGPPRIIDTGTNVSNSDTPSILQIGRFKVADTIRSIFSEKSGVIVSHYSEIARQNRVEIKKWYRDCQVILPDSSLLLPNTYPVQNPPPSTCRLLMEQMFGPDQNKKKGCGFYGREYIEGTGCEPDPPIDFSKCNANSLVCLEGGNVHFCEINGRNTALIGASSIIFTAGNMQLHGCFPDIDQLIQNNPSKATEIVFNAVCECIAKELKIDASSLLVLEHMLLHIDLETSVVLKNQDCTKSVILMYDPDLAKVALDYAHQRYEKRKKSFDPNETIASEYFKRTIGENQSIEESFNLAYQWIEKYKASAIYERNKKKSEEFGFEVMGVPGYFDCQLSDPFGSERGGQFLNGLLFHDDRNKKTLFITNAGPWENPDSPSLIKTPYSHFLAEPFYKIMKQLGISVVFVDTDGTNGGGIHCLSRMQRESCSSVPPQATPLHAEYLPKTIPTELQIASRDDSKNMVELIFTNSDSHQEFRFWFYPPYTVKVQVPIDGHLNFQLWVNGELFDDEECIILPGHPQLICLDS